VRRRETPGGGSVLGGDEAVELVEDDLFYIENMSWRMDLKILFNTFYVMLMGKGHT
jgi:lipopolysaccharide/colanic/teichoic acid biosynthesis glycosyltransferase